MKDFWEVEQFVWRPPVKGDKEGLCPQQEGKDD